MTLSLVKSESDNGPVQDMVRTLGIVQEKLHLLEDQYNRSGFEDQGLLDMIGHMQQVTEDVLGRLLFLGFMNDELRWS